MKKKSTKIAAGKKLPRQKTPAKKKKVEAWAPDPPRLMNAKQLAERYNRNDDQIRNWAKLPLFPPQEHHGLWPVALFDRAVAAMQEQGGPEAYKEAATMAIEQAGGITGRVPPTTPADVAAAAAAGGDDQAAQDAGNAITPHELLTLSQKNLLRTKTAEDIITRRIANQERRRKLVPRAEVEEALHARAQRAHALAQQFKLELIPKLVGLERAEMEMAAESLFDNFFRTIAGLGDPVHVLAGGAEPSTSTTAAAVPDATESK